MSQALLQHLAPLGIVAASLHVTRWCLAGFLLAAAANELADAVHGGREAGSDADNDGAAANDGWTCRLAVNAGSSALYPTTRPLAPFSPFSPSPLPHTQNQNTSPLSLSLTLL